ncbi:quinol dehydrogenase ferredoxin subunit NapH [Prolixibacteraceae bacterium JC049]|nr:quinol dehydrogenase ferredoxin subunit NapH [Prolixibacteraceae bacterium JC049]
MAMTVKSHRYLIFRRVIQLGLLTLFIGGNYMGWNILKGNFSFSRIADTVPLADPFAVLQMLAAGFTITSEILIGSIIILALYWLLGGRIFCSWICPLNLVTDTALWLRRKLGITTDRIYMPRNSRYYILAMAIILSAIIGYAAFESISPISIWFRMLIFGTGGGWAIVLAIFLLDISVKRNGWCGHICPLGAFYGVIGRWSLMKVKYKHDNCTQCMDCFKVCPEPQVLHIVTKHNGIIQSGECTNCGRCIEVCNDKALRFSVNNFKTQNHEK